MSSSSAFLYDPEKYRFYNLIAAYFDDPVLEKIRNEGAFDMYACRISTLLLNEYRYLIGMTYADPSSPIGERKALSDLKWVSFQTRILESESMYHICTHSYSIKNTRDFHFRVIKTESTTEHTVYELAAREYPIKISLLHKKGMLQEYPDQGTLVSCLETFQTIIVFKQ